MFSDLKFSDFALSSLPIIGMAWGWPWPTFNQCCCGPTAPVTHYHIRKYTNSSSMPLLASVPTQHICWQLYWDGTNLTAVYDETESQVGTGTGGSFLRAITYDVNLNVVRQIDYKYGANKANSSSYLYGIPNSVYPSSNGQYALNATGIHSTNLPGIAVINSNDTLAWEAVPTAPAGLIGAGTGDVSAVYIDSSGNVYVQVQWGGVHYTFIHKFNSAGVEQWKAQVFTTSFTHNLTSQFAVGLVADSNGNIWTGGVAPDTNDLSIIAYLAHVTPAGVVTNLPNISPGSSSLGIFNLSDGAGGIWWMASFIKRRDGSGNLIYAIHDPAIFNADSERLVIWTVDPSNNAYALLPIQGAGTGPGTIWGIRKFSELGTGTGDIIDWTSGDIGWDAQTVTQPISFTAPPNAIAADSNFIFVGGGYVI